MSHNLENPNTLENSQNQNSVQLIYSSDKAIKISLIAFVLSLIALIAAFKSMHDTQKIGTIDMFDLIAEHASHLAKMHQKSKVSDIVLKQSIEHLKEHIQSFGKNKSVILLSKNMVLSSDFKDYTSELKHSLQK